MALPHGAAPPPPPPPLRACVACTRDDAARKSARIRWHAPSHTMHDRIVRSTWLTN